MDRSLDEIIAEDTVRAPTCLCYNPHNQPLTKTSQLQRNKGRSSGDRPSGGRRSQGRRRGERDGVRKVLP
jgi:hypothetical protein